MLLWLVACFSPTPEAPPAANPLDPATWRFPSDAERQRYVATRAALAERFEGAEHTDLERVGNLLQESWEDGEAHATLAVLHAPATFPDVFGLVLDVEGRSGDVVTQAHWSRGGRKVTGDVLLVRVDTPDGELELSTTGAYEVGVQTLRADPVSPEALLTELRASPEALAERGERQIAAMAARVAAHLDSGAARRCETGDVPGDGKPPECRMVPLTDRELDAERQRLTAWSTEGTAVLRGHAEVLHAQLVAWLPAALR